MLEHAPFISIMATTVKPEQRPALVRWVESAVFSGLAAFGALKINDSVQDERIVQLKETAAKLEASVGESQRRVTHQLDEMTKRLDVLPLIQLNSERLLMLQERVRDLEREMKQRR